MAAETDVDKLRLLALLLSILFVTAHSRTLQPSAKITLSPFKSSDYSMVNATTRPSPESVPEKDEDCSPKSYTEEMISRYLEAWDKYRQDCSKCPNGTRGVCEAAVPPPYLDVSDYQQQMARRESLNAQTPFEFHMFNYGTKYPFPCKVHGDKSDEMDDLSCKWKKYYKDYNCKLKAYLLKRVEEGRLKQDATAAGLHYNAPLKATDYSKSVLMISKENSTISL